MSHRRLLLWSTLPIVVTLVLYFYGIANLQDAAQSGLTALLANWGFDPEGWFAWTLMILGKLLLWLIAALTFTFASSIVASPFNDLLAEKAEPLGDPPLSPVKDQSIKHQFRLILIDLGKTVAATGAGIAAFVFSLIPIINLITFSIAFLLVCFQYTSYPQTRRGIPLKEGVRFLFRHFFACTGFGASVAFLYTIPIVSSFALPLAVVGGTLLVARAQNPPGTFKLK